MQRLLILLLVKSMRGANLMLLAQPNKMEVLCTLFSPRYWQIVQEINSRNRHAVVERFMHNCGRKRGAQSCHQVQPWKRQLHIRRASLALLKSLQGPLLQLRVSQGDAAKQHRCRMGEGVTRLFVRQLNLRQTGSRRLTLESKMGCQSFRMSILSCGIC